MAPVGPLKVVLLDIEGTVCPISFVKDVLFPYALQALSQDLDSIWENPAFAQYRQAFPDEFSSDQEAFKAHVQDLVAMDLKVPYLKALQGYLWEEGYRTGKLRAPLFDDVGPALASWHSSGLDIMIYSSGSVPAQKLLFGHTTSQPSDMTSLITDWFDTVNAGSKVSPESYTKIISRYPDIEPNRWLFLSDNLKEVEAAQAAGMQSLVVIRPGNNPIERDSILESAVLDFSTLNLVPERGSAPRLQ